ncbi:hypothetical protein CMU20_02995 [Elizabethkingia anophelis]|nr:hypothetical protein [Elizabethkingia anophelis]
MSINSKVVFKDYNPKQNFLFPPNLSELIENNHPVRTISAVIDGLDISNLIRNYKPGGTSVYHPKMLLKVLIYGPASASLWLVTNTKILIKLPFQAAYFIIHSTFKLM